MADNFKPLQTQATTLYGSGAVLGAESVILSSLKDLEGNSIAMTDLGTLGFGTIEPGTSGQEEAITFTGITQNSNGTATLTGVKNQLGKAPYTQTSGLLRSHAGGTLFVLSNTAGFYEGISGKNNDETVLGTWTFTAPNYPEIDDPTNAPTEDGQFAPKKYIDDAVIAGGVKASETVYGISKLSSAPITASTPTVLNSEEVSATSGTSVVVRTLANGLIDASFLGITGIVAPYAGATAPTGWLLADGTAVSRTTYSGLFAITGTTYGVGDNSTTFNLPDLKSRVPVGKSADTNFDVLGEVGGSTTHVLTTDEMPSHTHTVGNGGANGGYAYVSNNNNTLSSLITGATGGGAAHNNLQPYITLNYIIKY